MSRRLLVLTLLSIIAIGGSTSVWATHQASQEPCRQDHDAWVAYALKKIESIKPGMTREQLLGVFTTEGGISTGLQRTFVSRDCPYFKVDVGFRAVGRPDRDREGRVTLLEDRRDIIRQYLTALLTIQCHRLGSWLDGKASFRVPRLPLHRFQNGT